MDPVYGLKPGNGITHTQFMGKCNSTSSSIPAHTTFLSISVKIDHVKVQVRVFMYQDESVCPNSKTAVTEMADKKLLVPGKGLITVIDHDEIVSCTLIFRKSGFQTLFLLNIVKNSKYL
jgi:hypothetical protein